MEFVDGLTRADLLPDAALEIDPATAAAPSRPERVRSIRSPRGTPRSEEATSEGKLEKTAFFPSIETLAVIGRVCGAVEFAHDHGGPDRTKRIALADREKFAARATNACECDFSPERLVRPNAAAAILERVNFVIRKTTDAGADRPEAGRGVPGCRVGPILLPSRFA